MRFVIYALDKPDALPRRLANIDAHRSYLGEAPERHGIKILLSGPLTQDDGETMRGSFFLLEAENRAVIEEFLAGDPMGAADVWSDLQISAVFVRQDNMSAA